MGSEQNLVDCSKENGGCNGGDMQLAYDYIKSNKGIDTESSYPYQARDRTCRYNAANVGATITGYEVLPSGDEDALVNALASVGPIAIAIDASQFSFQFYSGGMGLKRTVETVITTWITLFWPLDTVPNPKETTSSSRTPGVQAGALMDTLRWPATWTTSAELPPSVSTQPSKLSMKIQNFHLVLGLFFLVPE